MTLRTMSFGGGIQSTAVLVLAAQGRMQYDAFLFANVGHDSEHPDTLKYVEEYAKPFAAERGIVLHELCYKRQGEPYTLYGHLMRPKLRSIDIPVRMAGNGAPGRRNCTNNWKIQVIARWQKANGATAENPAITALGISIDEMQRARNKSSVDHQTLEYPLLDLRLTRQDCIRIVTDAGLPQPPKSACWFCPFQGREQWRTLKQTKPDLFADAVALEDELNRRRNELGKDAITLHSSGYPLAQAVAGEQPGLFDNEPACESGYCMT